MGLYADPERALALPQAEAVLDKVYRHYSRGEALARRADANGVRAEARAIAALRQGSDAPGLGRMGTPLSEVLQYVLEGRAAMLAGGHDAAASAYRQAMERQLSSGFGNDPPIFWYSVRRSLAAALLAGGDAEGARNQLLASLRRWPNDALALYALSLAERRLGDSGSADRNLQRARRVWAGEVTEVPLSRI
jgi:tetratricopeptide (TPR) repeat protein